MLPIAVVVALLHGLTRAQTPTSVFDPFNEPALIEKGDSPDRGIWLRQALARSASLQPDAEAFRVKNVIFDALIRTRTPAPLAELLPFFDRFPAAVIAVVAKGDPHGRRSSAPRVEG